MGDVLLSEVHDVWINAIVVCDCGHHEFRVGIWTDGIANHIRSLACTACGKQMAVPFQQGQEAPPE